MNYILLLAFLLGFSQSMRHGVARGAHVYLGYGEETELMQQGKTPLKPDS